MWIAVFMYVMDFLCFQACFYVERIPLPKLDVGKNFLRDLNHAPPPLTLNAMAKI